LTIENQPHRDPLTDLDQIRRIPAFHRECDLLHAAAHFGSTTLLGTEEEIGQAGDYYDRAQHNPDIRAHRYTRLGPLSAARGWVCLLPAMVRIISHIMPTHMTAAKMKPAPTTPVATSTAAMMIIGMQQIIIIQ
jgi:hypothetical protein